MTGVALFTANQGLGTGRHLDLLMPSQNNQ